MEVGAPVALFRKELAMFGPAATQLQRLDDGRFLMNVAPEDVTRPFTVALNWASTLKK